VPRELLSFTLVTSRTALR